MAQPWFEPALFHFLSDLKLHNDRDWFAAQKERYERDVRQPMLRFIAAAAEPLGRISRQVVADPRPVGGSLFRIQRDTRFSKDKSPYKTNAGAHFRHRAGRDAHAPGYYFHLAPGQVFVGAGVWHPDPPSLLALRKGIVGNAALWKRITGDAAFRAAGELVGESTKRVPRGFDPEHPLAEDLKRKSFTVLAELTEKQALQPDLLDRFLAFCKTTAPFNGFLCRALGRDW
jgi:uncharacterized protein (TIGR02453 family)